MQIDVVETKELEDGSLKLTIEMDEAGQNLLIQEGVISILTKHMEESLNEKKCCGGTCCTDVSDNS